MKLLEKVISLGLYLLAFLLPLQTRLFIRPGELNGGYFEYGTISLYATDILLIMLLLSFIIYRVKKKEKPIIENITYLIIGLNLASLISVLNSGDKLLSLFKYAQLTLGMGLFFLVSYAAYDYIKLLYSFLAGAALQALLGIWQFLAQATFASKWLGLAEHAGETGGTSVVETLAGERWLRAYGGLDHPNVLGGLLAVSILLTVYLMLRDGERSKITNYELPITNKIQNQKSKIRDFILYFLFFIFVSAIFFTFSRGAWLGLIAGLIVILALNLLQKNFSGVRNFFIIGAAASVLIAVLFINFSDLVTTRLSGGGRLEIKSNQERTTSYEDALKIIKNNGLVGVGIGGYSQSLIKLHPSESSWFYQPTHNVFLLVWAELGFVGLFLFVAIFANLIFINLKLNNLKLIKNSKPASPAGGFKIKNSNDDTGAKDNYIILALLFALLIIMLLDHYPWSLHFGTLSFWYLLGLLTRKQPRTHLTSEP